MPKSERAEDRAIDAVVRAWAGTRTAAPVTAADERKLRARMIKNGGRARRRIIVAVAAVAVVVIGVLAWPRRAPLPDEAAPVAQLEEGHDAAVIERRLPRPRHGTPQIIDVRQTWGLSKITLRVAETRFEAEDARLELVATSSDAVVLKVLDGRIRFLASRVTVGPGMRVRVAGGRVDVIEEQVAPSQGAVLQPSDIPPDPASRETSGPLSDVPPVAPRESGPLRDVLPRERDRSPRDVTPAGRPPRNVELGGRLPRNVELGGRPPHKVALGGRPPSATSLHAARSRKKSVEAPEVSVSQGAPPPSAEQGLHAGSSSSRPRASSSLDEQSTAVRAAFASGAADAEAQLRDLVRQAPKSADVWVLHAQVRSRQGRHKAAAESYERAKQYAPARRRLALQFEQGAALWSAGLVDAAVASWSAVRDGVDVDHPLWSSVRLRLAEAWVHLGRPDASKRELRAILVQRPGSFAAEQAQMMLDGLE